MWKYFALLSAVFAALTAILAKIGLKGVNSNLATAIRTVVIVILAWGIVAFSGELRGIKTLTRQNLLFLCLSGLATGLSWIFYFRALSTGPVSKVAPIDKLSVALAVTMAFLFLGEKPTTGNVLGAGLIVAGVLVTVFVK